MRPGRQLIAAALCTLVLAKPSIANTYIASEPPVSSTATLNEIDRALLLQLIRFSRFNTHFRLESNYHQPWRAWTYPLAREAGTGATFGGTLTDITQQAKGLHNLRRISKSAIKNGMAASLTGNIVSGCASSLELAQNTWVMLKAKQHGFDPHASVAFVKEVMTTTDSLFEKRRQLSASETSPVKLKIRELESHLLKRIRQQLLFEFLTWSVHSRDQAWKENTFYTFDALQSFTRMSAIILARKALDDPPYARGAAVTGLISNSVLTANPIVSNLTGYVVRRYQRHKLAKEFSFERPEQSDTDLQELRELQKNYPEDNFEQQLQVFTALSDKSGRLDITLDKESKQIARYQQIAQQQIIAGPIIGLTAMASSILSTVAIFNFRDKPYTANKLGLSGRISQSTGQVAALVLTPYITVKGMIRHHRWKVQEKLPEQVLAKRLANLDRVEEQVKTTSIH